MKRCRRGSRPAGREAARATRIPSYRASFLSGSQLWVWSGPCWRRLTTTPARQVLQARNRELHPLRLRGHKDIFRLEIAMNDALSRVRPLDRAQAESRSRWPCAHSVTAPEFKAIAQGFALEQLRGDHDGAPSREPTSKHREDIGVIQRGRRSRLPAQSDRALDGSSPGEGRWKNLDSDVAVQVGRHGRDRPRPYRRTR